MKKTWRNWVKLTKKIAGILASIILTLIYFILIIPLSFFIKSVNEKTLLGHTRIERKGSYWLKRKKIKYNLTEAFKQ